ncbi:hypothetical protein [Streptomyces sp. AC627_RSS907]|uniref:hypothetical protein n=1 Tax=Streptomyces sp. AC627_RSS907 TaxID=2823684 RepID=UPI001C264D9E|nr:hypothetical protein [Streptomyces sp. AC627_RSS907]
MASTNWETALSLFSDREGIPVSRMEVVKQQWVANSYVNPHKVERDIVGAGAPGGFEFGWYKKWYEPGQIVYNYQVGFNISPDLKDPLPQDKPLHQWHFGARDLLAQALSESGNSVFALLSFDDASNTVKGVQQFLDACFQKLKGWAEKIDVPESEMQGTAAGQFRSMLIGVANQFAGLHTQMINPSDFSTEIDDARTTAMERLQNLYHVMFAYGTEHNAWPAQILSDLFHEEFAEGAYTFNDGWLTTKTLGDPNTPGFWAAFEAKAKLRWLDQVGASLDGPASTAANAINEAYSKAATAIRPLYKPTWNAPAGTGQGGPDLADGKNPTADAIATLLNGLKNPQGGPGDPTKKALGTDGIGDGNQLPGGDSEGKFSGGGESFEQNGSGGEGTGTALENQLKNLNTEGPGVFDTKGITGGGSTNTGNTGLGNISTGSGTDEDATGPGVFGSGGGLSHLPPGSTVNKNGTVTGPDGKTLKNPDGSVYKAPPGAFQQQQQQQKQQEMLRREAEAQQKAYQERLKQQEEAQRRAEQQRRDNEKTLARLRETSRLTSEHPTPRGNGEGGTQQGKGVFKVRNPDGTHSEYAFGKNGKGPVGAEPPAGRVRTASAEPGVRVTEGTGSGPRTSSSPPMMPPPGAGGGAPAGQEQHRERKSYLDEDEETWGTQECTSTGVIG